MTQHPQPKHAKKMLRNMAASIGLTLPDTAPETTNITIEIGGGKAKAKIDTGNIIVKEEMSSRKLIREARENIEEHIQRTEQANQAGQPKKQGGKGKGRESSESKAPSPPSSEQSEGIKSLIKDSV